MRTRWSRYRPGWLYRVALATTLTVCLPAGARGLEPPSLGPRPFAGPTDPGATEPATTPVLEPSVSWEGPQLVTLPRPPEAPGFIPSASLLWPGEPEGVGVLHGPDPDALALLEEEAAIETLVRLRGFGRWSAEIYLLFALGRADVLPADDLAIQIAFQRLKRLESRPKGRLLRELTERWRPYRGAAAVFLWHYYGAATLDGQ